ncbi:MAG: transposase [Planctomycetaceae bacterium]
MGRRVDDGKHCEWSERIRRRRESGLTVAEFCEWEGVSVASFYNWQKRLRDTKSRSQSAELVTPEGRSPRSLQKASFLPVHVMQAGSVASPATRIEIHLTNGVRVFVPISDFETVENTIGVVSRLSALNGSAMNQDRPLAEDATC